MSWVIVYVLGIWGEDSIAGEILPRVGICRRHIENLAMSGTWRKVAGVPSGIARGSCSIKESVGRKGSDWLI